MNPLTRESAIQMKTTLTLPLLAVVGGFLLTHPVDLWAAEGSFINKRKVEGVKLGQFTWSQTVTADELTMIFAANGRLHQATRPTPDSAFVDPAPLTDLNVPGSEQTFPSLTDDGLILVFQRDPAGPTSDTDTANDLYQASRGSVRDPFGSVIRLAGEVNAHADLAPHISGDGLRLYFTSYRPGGHGGADIWVAARASVDDPFGAPVNFNDFYPGSTVNTAWDEYGPSLSRDGQVLFFSDPFTYGAVRPGGKGGWDIWVATRANTQTPFGAAVNLNDFSLGSAINTLHGQIAAQISPRWPAAGARLYYTTDEATPGEGAIWETTWEPAPGPEPPTLAITGDFVSLTWPSTEGTFLVETAPTIDGTWTVLARPVQEIGGQLEVLVPTSAGQQYFRLAPAEGLPDNLFERRIAGSYLVDFPDGSRLLGTIGLGGIAHRETSDDFIGLTGLPDLPFHRYSGGFGNWTRTGPRAIRMVELAFQFGADGLISAIPRVQVDLDFDAELRSASATATVEIFLPDQDPLTDAPLPGPTFRGLVFRRIQ
jgi:hypothetical protein